MSNYYIPLTLKDVICGIQGIIRESNGKLTGEEYVVNATYISDENNPDAPPGTLALHLRKGTMNPDEYESGTIVLMPNSLNERMM